MMRASIVIAGLAGVAWAGNPVVSVETKVSRAMTESTLTVEKVNAKLASSYRAHIERCYRERFGAKAKATGEVKLAFGVGVDGKTNAITVASFDKKLDGCIARRVKGWRFAVPKDASNKATATGFTFELVLTPIANGLDNSVRFTEEDASRFADLLMAESPQPSDGDMSRRRPGAELSSQIDNVKTGGSNRGVQGGGAIATGGGPKATTPSGRISVSSKMTLDETSLTPDAVLKKILTAYMVGLKRCYRNVLATKPALRGKVQLAFTVEATGRTTNAKAATPDPAMSACMQNMMSRWRFPIPMDADAPVSARFELGLAIVPD